MLETMMKPLAVQILAILIIAFDRGSCADELEFKVHRSMRGFQLTCSITNIQSSNFAHLNNLIISKRSFGSIQVLASVSSYQGYEDPILHVPAAEVSGHLFSGEDPHGSLRILWEDPESSLSGEYVCELHGVDDDFLPKTISKILPVEIGALCPCFGAEPDVVKIGLTRVLEITCLMPYPATQNISELESLLIIRTRAGVKQTVAGIDVYSGTFPHQVNLGTHIQGSLNKNMTFLTVRWDDPTADIAAEYTCKGSGMGTSGNSVLFNRQVSVTTVEPSREELLERLLKMYKVEKELKLCKESLDNATSAGPSTNSSVTAVETTRATPTETTSTTIPTTTLTTTQTTTLATTASTSAAVSSSTITASTTSTTAGPITTTTSPTTTNSITPLTSTSTAPTTTMTTVSTNSITTGPITTSSSPSTTTSITPLTSTSTAPTTSTTASTETTATSTSGTTTSSTAKTALLSRCEDLQSSSGQYVVTLQPKDNLEPFQVLCEVVGPGDIWTIFQKRFNGSVDFYRNFKDYKQGFGSPHGEFWLGLANIRRLLLQNKNKNLIRFDLKELSSQTKYTVTYRNFYLGPADGYRLNIDDSINDRGMGLSANVGQTFSTYDHGWRTLAGRGQREAGWWFPTSGGRVNINGRWGLSGAANTMSWYQFRRSTNYPMEQTTIKFQRMK